MEYRVLGKTQLKVSALGFGCGAVGGILVKGSRQEMLRAVARACDLGVNYFDTAPLYGDRASETNLGIVLESLGQEVIVGTKVRLRLADLENLETAITRSVESSLRRLRRETIDLLQLHNYAGETHTASQEWLNAKQIARTVDVFKTLRAQGVLAIRVLAGGALGDLADRPANAAVPIEPIASGGSFDEDLLLAQQFRFLVKEGYTETLAEAALRFASSLPAVSSTVLGISTLEQLEAAALSIQKGPLPAEVYPRLTAIWENFSVQLHSAGDPSVG
ncbi:MAG: aldo/keto reductase [Caldilinea sp.]